MEYIIALWALAMWPAITKYIKESTAIAWFGRFTLFCFVAMFALLIGINIAGVAFFGFDEYAKNWRYMWHNGDKYLSEQTQRHYRIQKAENKRELREKAEERRRRAENP